MLNPTIRKDPSQRFREALGNRANFESLRPRGAVCRFEQVHGKPAVLGSGAVGGHHHHHGGGGSEFATLLADLTDPTETDPTAGADSSILTADVNSTTL